MAVKLCGFGAVRCLLVLLNSIYIGIALFLIGLVVAARTLAYNFTGINILIGIGIVAGFLFIVAVLGFVGALRHNQLIMFFYMILLGLSGIMLFAVSVAALAVPQKFQEDVFRPVWRRFGDDLKTTLQNHLDCCGFDEGSAGEVNCSIGHPFCNTSVLLKGCCKNMTLDLNLTPGEEDGEGQYCLLEEPMLCPECMPCWNLWAESVGKGLKLAGGLGLLFSFTQIFGIVLTVRFRNLKDPTVNPVDML